MAHGLTSRRGAAHDRRSAIILRRTVPAARPVEPAAVVVAAPGDAAMAAAHRVSADTLVVRYRAQGRNALTHAVVVDGDPAHRRRPRHPGRGGADLESAKGARRQYLDADDPAGRWLERGFELGRPDQGRRRV